MQSKRLTKIIISLALCVLSILGSDSFAADPSFSITPISGTQLKLHCIYNFGLLINPNGQWYNWFDSTIKFDSGNISIIHQSIHPFFTSTTNGFIADGHLYRAYWVKPGGSWATVLTAANFLFSTTHNIISSFLEFTTRTWGTISFNQNTTDDGAVINSSTSSLDILTWVSNAGYTFLPLPCIIDNELPLIMNPIPSNNANTIASWQVVSFVFYDWAWPWFAPGIAPMTNTNNRSHYRYSGLNTSNLNNYKAAPSTVDNQEWIHSGTINVRISCPTCSWGCAYTLTAANLNIIPWTGNSWINRYTRDSADRGYAVSFPAPIPYGYEIEKEVTMIISWSDNPNELWTTHTGSFTVIFNSPVNPVISMTSPNNGATFIGPKISPITFDVQDIWAGIDTWSIEITVLEIYSGTDLLYTGKTYSGTDLTITRVSGQAWLGNSWSYQVSFVPTRYFPNDTWILITGYVKDLAGNITTGNRQFSTRPDCGFFWCSELFDVNILDGLFLWSFAFSWSVIQVTWTNTNSPYPYFTWVYNEILMCGRPYTWAILTGNIWIYDTSGTQINDIFTGDKLYITWMDGLDFILSGNVVIIQ